MASISLQIPQVGLPDSTEEAKVASDFTTLQNVINGNLDTSNLASNAGILISQIAGGSAFLTPATSNVNATVAAGQFLNMTGASTTATLPVSPATGTLLGVKAGATIGAGGPITVSAGSALIVYPGTAGVAVTTVTLGMGNAWVTLLWNGVVWAVVGGMQDTGWVALGLNSGWSAAAGTYTPAARLLGDRVWLRGGLTYASGVASPAQLAAGMRPASPVLLAATQGGASVNVITIAISGVITTNSQASIGLDGLSFSVV